MGVGKLNNFIIYLTILPKIITLSLGLLIAAFLISLPVTMNYNPALAHRSGCHRVHSCPSDTGSYVCGDLGNYSQCPGNSSSKSTNDKSKSLKTQDKTKTKTCQEDYHKSSGKCVPNKAKTPKTSTVSTNATLLNGKCQGLADCFQGKVIEVIDGDTLDVNNVRIRLALVNTPEVYEDGYQEARAYTMNNCGIGTNAFVDEDDGQKGGSFGRMIALVYCGNNTSSLNELLLNSSNASILPEFCDVSEFASSTWAKNSSC